MNTSNGIIRQVMGPVVDVEFPDGRLPDIFTALRTSNPSIDAREDNLTLEVAQHLGENMVRCIAMDTTDGLRPRSRGANTGAPSRCRSAARCSAASSTCSAPVDELGPLDAEGVQADPPRAARPSSSRARGRDVRDRHQGHRPARAVRPRRQDRPVRRRRRRQDRAHHGAHQQRRQGHGGLSVFAGVGERTREGNDLWHEMQEGGERPSSSPATAPGPRPRSCTAR
jgi:F-type H+-transporting ATPase subunit beta